MMHQCCGFYYSQLVSVNKMCEKPFEALKALLGCSAPCFVISVVAATSTWQHLNLNPNPIPNSNEFPTKMK
jgi:hypothetical protein